MKKLLIIFFALGLALQTAPQAAAIQARSGKMVKVGISDNNFSNYYFQTAEISATDDFELIDKATGSVICEFLANTIATVELKNGLFDVYMNGKEVANGLKGPIAANSEKGFLYIPNLKRAGKAAIYRGTFELTKTAKDDKFSLINVLDLESYLRGVVPNEMPVSFGLEALKAQTITARNYVLKPRENNYHNFDVCDSVACQVYFGAGTEQSLSDRAIVETENIVAMYDGELILALYSSTAGGHTESYENAFSDPNAKTFPAPPIPYLKGVPDNDKIGKLEKEGDVRRFYQDTPATFDNKSPYFRWTREWEAQELENVLKKTLKTNSPAGFVKPALLNEEDFGTLKNIKVIRRGVSGKAMAVQIETDKNTFVVQKELIIRRVFQKSAKPLPSANIIFDLTKDNKGNLEKIYVTGGGFGHGVGMSQWGAGMMASMGYSYDEILKHYYTGIQTVTAPVTLTNELNQDTETLVFYTKNKNTVLKIENKFQFTNLTVVINRKQLNLEIAPHPFKLVEVDITPYVHTGRNQITFMLPYTDKHKKSVRIYAELNSDKRNKQ